MSFRGLLRPGQGFRRFYILRREGDVSKTGRAHTGSLSPCGDLFGIITNADPKVVEQFKQHGTPITHTIVQRGTTCRAKATDILELTPHPYEKGCLPRRFIVHGEPKDPGELGHFLIYHVEERADLK